jgi:hypothetical protein
MIRGPNEKELWNSKCVCDVMQSICVKLAVNWTERFFLGAFAKIARSDYWCCTAVAGSRLRVRQPPVQVGWYALYNPTAVPGPSPFHSGTGGELNTASLALPLPAYFILLRSSSMGKLAVFFGNLVRTALVNPLRGGGR